MKELFKQEGYNVIGAAYRNEVVNVQRNTICLNIGLKKILKTTDKDR
jgi:hypothetical protein